MFLQFNIVLLLGLAQSFLFPSFFRSTHVPLSMMFQRKQPSYPISKIYHQQYMNRITSGNYSNNRRILKKINRDRDVRRHYFIENDLEDDDEDDDEYEDDEDDDETDLFQKILSGDHRNTNKTQPGGFRVIINRQGLTQGFPNFSPDSDTDVWGRPIRSTLSQKNKKSENFEVIMRSPYNFSNVGGYDNIKQELEQCVDLLSNYTKYSKYNIRIPKGLILEGPPGNGKTMLAKALAGEANTSFITVSGSQFQDKYVGVGSSRIRELFELAQKNIPCIIFIDEIDALCRRRSGDGETSGNERDNTLNELLVAMDGFKNTSGIFVIGATNRADLLDDALLRPGRIDKRIYISNPDNKTRKAILDIHIQGKPYDRTVSVTDLVETTNGFSGAQLENLLNEAMLNALRQNRNQFTDIDVDLILNKMMVGWQPNEHQFTSDIIDHIAIHELGHAVVGLLSKHHAKMTKVVINLSAPKSPAYTVFESSASNILTREALLEHLMILLSGRIAEEVVYGVSVTTGAINDFEEALKLAERMICYYGMGKYPIYPSLSEKYKEKIDNDVSNLINDAYAYAEFLIRNSKDLIMEGAELLKKQKVMKAEELIDLMNTKYQAVLNLKI